jgi:peptidoglycan/xylan/chitin deacetylase (PgdA/CDA1 family)
VRRSALCFLLAGAACSRPPLAEIDEVYYDWDDRRVLCAAGLDESAGSDFDSVRSGLERAAERGEVISLYAHRPGGTVSVERIESVLDAAAELGLDFVTYPDLLAGGPPRAALSLSFDDAHVDEWYDLRELFTRYEARVTFFLSRYDRLSGEERDKLRALAGDGHSIEAHSRRHQEAPVYVEDSGLDAYMEEEALPSIENLRADGFDPIAYAYPFGARTSELDDALLEHVQLLRSVTFVYESPLVTDPCPE